MIVACDRGTMEEKEVLESMQELESYLFTKKGLLHAGVFFVWMGVFFLLFLFGDTFHRWWLTPLFVVTSLLAFAPNPKKFLLWKETQSRSILALFAIWSLALISWGVSAFFSQNIPFSLDAMKVQATLYTVFWIVYFRSTFLRKVEITQITTLVFILVGLLLCTLSIIFSFNPVWAAKLPSFNILYASYGHNHLASYLLLILPLSWWWVLKSRSSAFIVVPVFLTFSLLFSFGRVAVSIGLVQLIISGYFFFTRRYSAKKQLLFFSSTQKKVIEFLVLVLVSLFISILFFKFLFSFVYSFFPESSCPIPQYRMQLCKPISNEARPEYWLQALRAVREYPIFGYGIGTFALISNRYASQAWNTTGYAHNSYLHFFAETGVIGGVLFLAINLMLIIVLIQKLHDLGVKKADSSVDSLFIFAVLMGFSSLLINNLLDFDWSFISVASSAVILIALTVSTNSEKENIKNTGKLFTKDDVLLKKFKSLSLLTILSKLFFALILIFICVLFLLTASTERLYHQKKYSEIVSFFPYVSHYSVAFSTYENWQNHELEKLVAIQHKNYHFMSDIVRNYKDYKSWLDWYRLLQVSDPYHQYTQSLVHLWLRENGTREQKITFYEDFIVDYDTLSKREKSKNKAIMSFNAKPEMLATYMDLAGETYLIGQTQQATLMYLNAQKIDEWIFSDSRLVFLDATAPKPDVAFLHTLANQAKERIGRNGEAFVKVYRELLFHEMVTVGYPSNEFISNLDNSTQTGHEFFLSSIDDILSINPWLNNEIWIEISQLFILATEDESRQDISSKTDITLADYWFSYWQVSEKYNKQENSEYSLDYDYKLSLVRQLQRAAFSALSENDTLKAVQFTQMMQSVLPNDYPSLVQIGNLYMYLGEYELAKKAYLDCIEVYSRMNQGRIHYHCQTGLNSDVTDNFWKHRYMKVGKIILLEADWSDYY